MSEVNAPFDMILSLYQRH